MTKQVFPVRMHLVRLCSKPKSSCCCSETEERLLAAAPGCHKFQLFGDSRVAGGLSPRLHFPPPGEKEEDNFGQGGQWWPNKPDFEALDWEWEWKRIWVAVPHVPAASGTPESQWDIPRDAPPLLDRGSPCDTPESQWVIPRDTPVSPRPCAAEDQTGESTVPAASLLCDSLYRPRANIAALLLMFQVVCS